MGPDAFATIDKLDSISGSGLCIIAVLLIILVVGGPAILSGLNHGTNDTTIVGPRRSPPKKVHHWNDPLQPETHSQDGETTYRPDPGGSRYRPEEQKPLSFDVGVDPNTPQSELVYTDMGKYYRVSRR
jgi:hypothetical protein